MKHALITALSTLLFLACGNADSPVASETTSGGEAAAPPPAVPADANWLAYVPESAFGVGVARVDVLRQSPYWQELASMLREGEPLGEGSGERLMSALERTERVAFAMHMHNGGPDVSWLFVQGDYEPGEVVGLLGLLLPPNAPPFEEGSMLGLRTYGVNRVVLVELDARSYLFGPRETVTEALLEQARRGPSSPLLSDARYSMMAGRVGLDQSAVAGVWVATDAARQTIDHEAADLNAPPGSVQAVGARGDVSSGLSVEAHASTNSGTAAEAIAGTLRAKQREISGTFVLRAMGLGAVIEGIAVSTDGADVHVEGRADDETVRDLLGRFRTVAILGMRQMAEQR